MMTMTTMAIPYKNSNVGISYISGQLNEESKIRIADNRSLPPVLSVFPFPSLSSFSFPRPLLLFSFPPFYLPLSLFFPSSFPFFPFLFPFPLLFLPLSPFCRLPTICWQRPIIEGGMWHPPHLPARYGPDGSSYRDELVTFKICEFERRKEM